ncbi:MAG: hypothetical protein QW472_04430 [Candidatus Aenigmatarchaeota archaeon]
MGIKEWFDEEIKKFIEENIKKDIPTLEKIEELLSLKGCLRVLYVFHQYPDRSLRYSALCEMTLLPLATLDRVLNFLISKNIVEKGKEFFTSPRKEAVTVYKISSFGKNICKVLFEYNIKEILSEENLKKIFGS